MAKNDTTKPTYIRPEITEAGSLADLTLEGQRLNTDSRATANSAIAFESV